MAKDWMFKGFPGDATRDDEIRACINQGKFMIEIAEKIKNDKPLTKMEKEWAYGIVRARGKDQIINPTKYISKEENGAPADPRRYEAVLTYYCYLRVLNVKKRAIELVCYEYEEITSDNLKSWIKQEREAGQPIKRQADDMIIKNPESIINGYEKMKGKN
ncbi:MULTISPECIES: hypothetical protein [Acinetobacter calcoaceticus/baumannii complex]|uniref:hypothetical protein n=1 Tax=Acinetobacter calcoaceticus/baumannii complex TaxID=909768 RepID=UPI0019D13FE0|nr:hypothetical protein [Acinetobacter baumannii]MDV7499457.1 hypothetical protein [Acinetobacter baumannii]HBY7915437.1 hypothetical protein [Acinetobacter baumannii]HBY9044336.1 hypothetical protein [Acinetobacter baumannii]HDZ1844349.1 hypothetical protein [Acinetobacter baumannii]